MADKDDKAAGDGAPAQKKKMAGKKLVLFIVLPLLLLLGGGGAAAFFLLQAPAGESAEAAEGEGGGKEADGAEAQQADLGPAIFYELPEMLVNLNTGGKQAHFLRVKVALELPSAEEASRIEAVLPRVIDNFQVYLRELRVEDLQGSQGLVRLKEELLVRLNVAVGAARINDVLFKEMLVQ